MGRLRRPVLRFATQISEDAGYRFSRRGKQWNIKPD
jgi:hypothetical protein